MKKLLLRSIPGAMLLLTSTLSTVAGAGQLRAGDLDVINDGQDVKIRLQSSSGRNQYAAPIELALQCKNGQATASIAWNEYLVADMPIAVKLDGQLNNDATQGWRSARSDQEWVMDGGVVPMLKALVASSTMQVDVRSFETDDPDTSEEGDIRAIWDLSSLATAARPFLASCTS